jgi:hypothetical protein
MWKIKINWKNTESLFEIDSLTKVLDQYGECYVEDRINDYLFDIIEDELDIWDRVEEAGWVLDYKVYDDNDKLLDY